MLMPARQYWTSDMVRALPPDGKRYECVYGELLVSPSPRVLHQVVLGRLYLAVAQHVQVHGATIALFSPSDISWRPDSLVQPDLFVVPVDEARTGWTAMRSLSLVIEVVSPSTARYDRFTKRVLYQREGVNTYWIVDPKSAQVEVWTPSDRSPTVVTDELCWRAPGESSELVISLASLFAPF